MHDEPVVGTYDVSLKTLAFVIDTTATMAEDRKQIASMFSQLPSLKQYYRNYVLATYNDPSQSYQMNVACSELMI